MNQSLIIKLAEIRTRANAQLDGITRGRERMAKDALALCDAVERLSAALVHQKQGHAINSIFESIFGDIPESPTKH